MRSSAREIHSACKPVNAASADTIVAACAHSMLASCLPHSGFGKAADLDVSSGDGASVLGFGAASDDEVGHELGREEAVLDDPGRR